MLVRLRVCLLLFLAFTAGISAHAQLGVYAMATGAFVGANTVQQGSASLHTNSFAAFGGTFGLYAEFAHLGPVRFGVDGRFFAQSGSNSNTYGNKLHGGLGGARLAFKLPLVPIKPYVQGEIGDTFTNYGTQPNNSTAFTYQVQGGIDFTFFPHLDGRVEYGGGQMDGVYSGTTQSLQQGGAGLVVRF